MRIAARNSTERSIEETPMSTARGPFEVRSEKPASRPVKRPFWGRLKGLLSKFIRITKDFLRLPPKRLVWCAAKIRLPQFVQNHAKMVLQRYARGTVRKSSRGATPIESASASTLHPQQPPAVARQLLQLLLVRMTRPCSRRSHPSCPKRERPRSYPACQTTTNSQAHISVLEQDTMTDFFNSVRLREPDNIKAQHRAATGTSAKLTSPEPSSRHPDLLPFSPVTPPNLAPVFP
jgi:hypothetical protein